MFGKWSKVKYKYLCDICLERLRITTVTLRQGSRSGEHSNQELPDTHKKLCFLSQVGLSLNVKCVTSFIRTIEIMCIVSVSSAPKGTTHYTLHTTHYTLHTTIYTPNKSTVLSVNVQRLVLQRGTNLRLTSAGQLAHFLCCLQSYHLKCVG